MVIFVDFKPAHGLTEMKRRISCAGMVVVMVIFLDFRIHPALAKFKREICAIR